MDKTILTRFLETNRKTILPAAVEKALREGDAEVGRLIDLYGRHHPQRIKAANRDAAEAFVQNPTDANSEAFFKSMTSRLEEVNEIRRRAKDAARVCFVNKCAAPLAGVFERVAVLFRQEAEAEARAMRERAKRWKLEDAVRCPIEAILRSFITIQEQHATVLRAYATGKEFIGVAPRPSEVLANSLQWEPLR